jgi:glycosyltransferase involved in cell wall biosynthesis
MKIAFITRSTLFTDKGGDTIQVIKTAAFLVQRGILVDVKLTSEAIDYSAYDLLHFFNIIRPADIYYHICQSNIPFVVSPILIDYSQYDMFYRKGVAGFIFSFFSQHTIEYLKTIARWVLKKDRLKTLSYIWKGQRVCIHEIVQKSSLLLPNSHLEAKELKRQYNSNSGHIVPNGIDPALFTFKDTPSKNARLVLCVARIEGLKNQLNLIKALNNTAYELVIIGTAATNQQRYYQLCREAAAANVTFIDHITQHELVPYYQQATVHVLPSWFETCGLSSLEAAVMGCNVVITDKGYTTEYFENYAFYCDPASPESIRKAVDTAANTPFREALRHKIINNYTWQQAAEKTLKAYHQVLQ